MKIKPPSKKKRKEDLIRKYGEDAIKKKSGRLPQLNKSRGIVCG